MAVFFYLFGLTDNPEGRVQDLGTERLGGKFLLNILKLDARKSWRPFTSLPRKSGMRHQSSELEISS
ncbi:MAG: hypothetical protein KME06_02235 [Kastovskya adunca ATA6-11-RM4]|nr:hypothetical protein [Kastovskya adunca ATA6-11-RM4]